MTNYTELKRLAEAATPGPWKVKDRKVVTTEDASICCSPVFRIGAYKQSMANTEYFAAASPDVVLSMIADIEQLNRELDLTQSAYEDADKNNNTLRTQNQALLEACKTGLEYVEECLIDYDQSCAAHPAIKAGRGIIVSDVDAMRAAIKLAEGKDV